MLVQIDELIEYVWRIFGRGLLLALAFVIATNAHCQALEPFETSLLRTEGCVEETGEGFCKAFGKKFEAWKKGLIDSPSPEHRYLSLRVKPAFRKEKRDLVLELTFTETNKTTFWRFRLRKGTSCAQAAELAFSQFHYWLYGRPPLASDRAQFPP